MDKATLDKLNIIFSRRVVLFGGEYGRCKSLSLTALVFWESIITKTPKIFSNMPLKYPFESIEIIPLIETGQFDLDRLSHLKNSIGIWDEIMNDLKARSPMSETNKYISQMAVGFRKDNIKLRASLQYARSVDIALDDIVELKIIPTLKNQYSKDATEDRKIRLEKKDFWVRWDCKDEKENSFFDLQLNLYPYLRFYNTAFKPYRMILTHSTYEEKLKMASKRKYETYLDSKDRDVNINLENWNLGYDEI